MSTAAFPSPGAIGDGSAALPVSDSRRLWLDAARGLAIVLVVYGHALRALFPKGEMPRWAQLQDDLIYGFHMPLFFVASGLFLWKQIARGRAPFLSDRLRLIVYPYFLWSLITGVLELIAAPWVNTPMAPVALLRLPIEPIEQYWFLYALLVVQLTAFAVYPSRIALAVLAIALGVAVPLLGGGLMLWRSFAWLPYLAAGVLGAAALERLQGVRTVPLLLLTIGCWLAYLGVFLFPAVDLAATLRGYALGFLGTAGTFMTAMLIARGGVAASIAALGAASMAIFVAHTIFSAGARIVLNWLFAGAPLVLTLAVTTVAGIIGPLLLLAAARRWRLLTVLGLGKDRRSPDEASAPSSPNRTGPQP